MCGVSGYYCTMDRSTAVIVLICINILFTLLLLFGIRFGA